MVALLGFVTWWRAEPTTCAAALIVIAAFFAFNVSFNGWEGGFGIGGRYLVADHSTVDDGVAARPAADGRVRRDRSFVRDQFRRRRSRTAAVGDDPRPLTQYIVPLLPTRTLSLAVPITPPWSAATFTGHTSVNRMTLDEAIVFTRHAPDDTASEWASFNIGELATGPGDARR